MKITDLVRKDNVALFNFYRNGNMYYNVTTWGNDTYQFPVSLEDIGNATLNNSEKSLTLMRYIRKAMEDGTLVPYNFNTIIKNQEDYKAV